MREMGRIDFHPVIQQSGPAEFIKHDHDNMSGMTGDDVFFEFQF